MKLPLLDFPFWQTDMQLEKRLHGQVLAADITILLELCYERSGALEKRGKDAPVLCKKRPGRTITIKRMEINAGT